MFKQPVERSPVTTRVPSPQVHMTKAAQRMQALRGEHADVSTELADLLLCEKGCESAAQIAKLDPVPAQPLPNARQPSPSANHEPIPDVNASKAADSDLVEDNTTTPTTNAVATTTTAEVTTKAAFDPARKQTNPNVGSKSTSKSPPPHPALPQKLHRPPPPPLPPFKHPLLNAERQKLYLLSPGGTLRCDQWCWTVECAWVRCTWCGWWSWSMFPWIWAGV